MDVHPQHTLAQPIELNGIALHSGTSVKVTVNGAEANNGIVFEGPGGERIPANLQSVVDTRLATTLGNDHWRVATVEHLLAALLAEGVDNAVIKVHGNELPALDGSSAPWVTAIRAAGRLAQQAPRNAIVVTQAVTFQDGPRTATLLPHPNLRLTASIAFAHPSVGEQTLTVDLTAETFTDEIAWARTFGFHPEVRALRAAGLAQGGCLDNAVVFGAEGVLNHGGLKAPDEPVRHKVLDMVGDLALLGLPLVGHLTVTLPGHAVNVGILHALMDAPSCYKITKQTQSPRPRLENAYALP